MHYYNMARKLANSEFIKLLYRLRGLNPNNAEVKRLGIAHTRFINRVQQISKLDSQSKLDSLQALARLRELLIRLQEKHEGNGSLRSSRWAQDMTMPAGSMIFSMLSASS